MTDIEELEKILQLPDAVKEVKEEPEWQDECKVRLLPEGWLESGEKGPKCAEPVVVNITMICPFCGPETAGYCERHKDKALKGELVCARCSIKGKAKIHTRPVSAIWKTE